MMQPTGGANQMTENRKGSLCLLNVTLIDGTGAAARSNVDIHVKDGRIQSITDSTKRSSTDGLDLTGHYVLPGLIDCHVHLCIDGAAHGEVRGSQEFILLKMLKHAEACLSAGITTMRDVGGWYHVEFALRQAFENGLWSGPRLALAGKLLSITSSGADLYPGMYREADGSDEVRKAAREQFKAGADLIKLMASGAVMAKGEKPESTQYGVDEMSVVVEEASKLGKSVAAHAHAAAAIRNAVEAGVTSIEHGTFLYRDPRLMEQMCKKGTFLVPTLKVFHDMVTGAGVPDWMQEKAKVIFEHHARSIKEAIAAGVPIAMGTDAATPYNFHGQNALELHLMNECGMSPMQAIVAATSNAARLLGWDDWLGTIQSGKAADLIVVRKNPLDDLRVLTKPENIAMVVKEGTIVSQTGKPNVESEHYQPSTCCGIPEDCSP
jgi:imidazolonepropionase-like amidohydrolase